MRLTRWLPLVVLLAGCADEIPEDVSSEMDARRAATRPQADTLQDSARISQLLEEAPAGGYADWVADIRAGLDSVTADAAVDRGDALHSAQELYSRRYEYLVAFYGGQGATHSGAGLAQAVEQVGSQLQELMRRLADNQADAARIGESVNAVKAALTEVESQGRAAGLPPSAPRLPITSD